MKRLATLTTSLIVLLGLSVAFDAVGCKQPRHFWIYVQGYSGKEIPNISIKGPHIRPLEYKGYKLGKNKKRKDAYSKYLSNTCLGSKPSKTTLTIEGKTIFFTVTSHGEIIPTGSTAFQRGVGHAYSDKYSGPNYNVLVVRMKEVINKP